MANLLNGVGTANKYLGTGVGFASMLAGASGDNGNKLAKVASIGNSLGSIASSLVQPSIDTDSVTKTLQARKGLNHKMKLKHSAKETSKVSNQDTIQDKKLGASFMDNDAKTGTQSDVSQDQQQAAASAQMRGAQQYPDGRDGADYTPVENAPTDLKRKGYPDGKSNCPECDKKMEEIMGKAGDVKKYKKGKC